MRTRSGRRSSPLFAEGHPSAPQPLSPGRPQPRDLLQRRRTVGSLTHDVKPCGLEQAHARATETSRDHPRSRPYGARSHRRMGSRNRIGAAPHLDTSETAHEGHQFEPICLPLMTPRCSWRRLSRRETHAGMHASPRAGCSGSSRSMTRQRSTRPLTPPPHQWPRGDKGMTRRTRLFWPWRNGRLDGRPRTS